MSSTTQTMNDYIAKVNTRYVDAKGEQGDFTISIGRPSQQKTGEYACPVYLPDLQQPTIIYGEDSLQALSLAMQFAAQHINDLLANGWQFFYPDSDFRIPFEVYFIQSVWTEKLQAIAKQTEHALDGEKGEDSI